MRLSLVVLVAALLGGCSDPRCSAEGFAKVSACRSRHYLEPSYARCTAGMADAGAAAAELFVEACHRFGLGYVVQCAEELNFSCTAMSSSAQLSYYDCLDRRAPARDRDVALDTRCLTACFAAKMTCDQGCTPASTMTCGGCLLTCSATLDGCIAACPIDTR